MAARPPTPAHRRIIVRKSKLKGCWERKMRGASPIFMPIALITGLEKQETEIL